MALFLVLGSWSASSGCDNNWSMWAASSRLQWDVTKSFYLGVEVMYDPHERRKFENGVLPGNISGLTGAPGPTAGFQSVGGSNVENAWNVTVRMHKDFLP